MESYQIKDDKDRVIISIGNNGKIAIARYLDLCDDIKDYIIDFYRETTSANEKDIQKLRKFLNFETKEVSFCS